MSKPCPYRFFGNRGNYQKTVLQVRHHETREAVAACDLEAYRAKVRIKTPWDFDILPGSKLMLMPEAARFMLDAGSLEPLDEPVLIPWRDREAAAQGKFSQG